MADTSPHDADHQRGRQGMPGQIADHRRPTLDAMSLDSAVAERRCWRCLRMFPGDSTRAPTLTPEWWLCDPCDRILLAPKQRAA